MIIDPSLARGIRRSYLRRLEEELRAEGKRRQQHDDRNAHFSVETRRGFAKSCNLYRERLGPLLLVADVVINTRSRQAWAGFLLEPVTDPWEALRVSTRVVLRPCGAGRQPLRATFSLHAIDRVVQRSRLVVLPLGAPDIAAINSEFSDTLPFIPPALRALNRLEQREAARINIILPACHGLFLGSRDEEEGGLVIKTYVDRERLRSSQLQAIEALDRICDAQLSVQALAAQFPDWLSVDSEPFDLALIEIWREFGSRLAEECVEPGLSDEAWANREPVRRTRRCLDGPAPRKVAKASLK